MLHTQHCMTAPPLTADLVPREVGEKWLAYFREELPCVAFKCSTQQQGRGLKQGRAPAKRAAGASEPDFTVRPFFAV
jgi:hypothetical protein